MFKFLRQYNQWILVVGGTLLLVTFLMPSAIQNCAHQSAVSGAEWATYGDGKKLTGKDLDTARRELAIVELLRDPNPGRDPLARIGADKDPAHWWMLAHEAERAGLVGGEGEGEAVLATIASRAAAAGNPLTTETILRNMTRTTGANREFALMTTAKWRGVSRLLSMCESVDRISDRRLEQFVAKAILGMSGDLVVLDARANASIPGSGASDAEIDAKLEEHFRKFADTPAPTGAAKELFGYRMPDRVKLEWLTISKSAVEATVQGSPELQTIALKKRFAQDPKKYGADPATNPAFAGFESAVRTRTVEELTKAKLDEIAKFASDQLGLAQRSLKRKNSYFVLPEDWDRQMPSFATISAAVASEFGIPAPMLGSSGDAPVALDTVPSLPDIGRASTSRFGQAMRLPQLVSGAKEFAAQNPAAPVQARIAGPSLTGDNGDVYLFRILEALPSAAAADLASVREQVRKDVLGLDRFKWLENNQAEIAKAVAADGLRAVADKYGAKVEFVKELRQFNSQIFSYGFRMSTPIPGLGADPKALAALVEKASALPLTSDLSSIPAAERTFVVAAPDRLSILVFQVSELHPMSRETLATMRTTPEIIRATHDDTVAVDLTQVFGFDALANRIGFKRMQGEQEGANGKKDSADKKAAEAPAKTASAS